MISSWLLLGRLRIKLGTLAFPVLDGYGPQEGDLSMSPRHTLRLRGPDMRIAKALTLNSQGRHRI